MQGSREARCLRQILQFYLNNDDFLTPHGIYQLDSIGYYIMCNDIGEVAKHVFVPNNKDPCSVAMVQLGYLPALDPGEGSPQGKILTHFT